MPAMKGISFFRKIDFCRLHTLLISYRAKVYLKCTLVYTGIQVNTYCCYSSFYLWRMEGSENDFDEMAKSKPFFFGLFTLQRMDICAGGERSDVNAVVLGGEQEEGGVERDVHVEDGALHRDLVEDAELVERPDDHGPVGAARHEDVVGRVNVEARDHAAVVLDSNDELAGRQVGGVHHPDLRARQHDLLGMRHRDAQHARDLMAVDKKENMN